MAIYFTKIWPSEHFTRSHPLVINILVLV